MAGPNVICPECYDSGPIDPKLLWEEVVCRACKATITARPAETVTEMLLAEMRERLVTQQVIQRGQARTLRGLWWLTLASLALAVILFLRIYIP